MRNARAEKKARTRRELVAAARVVFGRHGFHAASLEEIAAAAGVTTGAVYSSFSGKEELFLAVFDEHIAQRLESTRRALEGPGTVEQRIAAAADDWIAFLRRQPEWFPLFVEFWSWAVRDPRLRGPFAAQHRRFADAHATLMRELGLDSEIAQRGGAIVTALADGVALMKLADPAAVPDDLLAQAMLLLLRAVRR